MREGISVFCGERIDDCAQTALPLCEIEYAFEAFYDADVELGPDSVTWTVTFDGDLAPFAADHAEGLTIGFGVALAGPSRPDADTSVAAFTCGELACGEVVGDFVFTDATYTIR